MTRRLALLTLLALLIAAPAAADLGTRKRAVDSQLATLQDRVAQARAREATLSSEIATVTTRIRGLETRVGDVSTRLGSIQDDLSLHRSRLDRLTALFDLETRQLRFLQRQYADAVRRLNARLVRIYESGDPTTIEVILASRSFQSLLDQLDYLNAIAAQDKRVASDVRDARQQVYLARAQTATMRAAVASETKVIVYRAQQQAALRDNLLAGTNALAGARAQKRRDLGATQENESQWVAEANALSGVSAQLAAQIQAAQAGTPPPEPSAPAAAGAPTSGSMIWPVSGPITSPFGIRWGSLHPGIDIGVGTGTPIRAAAAGRVIVASYDGGYGNLVVIDHGSGIATAYAHQSRMAVSVGQQVSQGQVIGYVGSTGFSTGPHLHFEVRVNGTPVDPMGYL